MGVQYECGWVYRMSVGGCTEWVWVGVQYGCGWVYTISLAYVLIVTLAHTVMLCVHCSIGSYCDYIL